MAQLNPKKGNNMIKNVGSTDRNMRYVSAALLVFIALLAPIDLIWRVIVLVMAVIAYITAITGW